MGRVTGACGVVEALLTCANLWFEVLSSKDVAGHVDDAGCAVLGSVYEDLATDVGPGDPLLLSDGNLSVKYVTAHVVACSCLCVSVLVAHTTATTSGAGLQV